jgi:hypothetical protein
MIRVYAMRALAALLMWGVAGAARADELRASPTEGLRWRSSDGALELHGGGVFAGDAIWQTSGHPPGSALRTDYAAPFVEARYREVWSARLVGDLEGTKTPANLYEASVAWQRNDDLRVSLGLMPLPLGFEEAIPYDDLPFAGYSFARYMSYRTDWAARVQFQLGEGIFDADLSASLGDGFDWNGNPRRDPQLSGRGFVRPLRFMAGPDASWLGSLLGGFFLGGGYAHAFDYQGELDIRSPVGGELFDTPRFEADYSHYYTIVAGFEVGPVRFFYEGTQGGYFNADTPVGEQDLDNQTDSWQATLSWRITGEPYDGRIFREREPPGRGPELLGPNAWEVAARYANADIDRDFFAFGLTDDTTSSQEFRSFSLAVNWYATRNLRVSAEFVRTQADDDIKSLGFDGDDSAGILRAQYRF